MKISISKILLFFFSVISSVFVGCSAYHEPLKFVVFTDLLATIISILIGVSLAISSILSSPATVSDKVSPAQDGKQRVEEVLKLDSLRLYQGQHIIFWIYYFSLIFAVLLKFLSANATGEVMTAEGHSMLLNIVSALFAFFSCMSLLWSATLPTMLHRLNRQRSELS